MKRKQNKIKEIESIIIGLKDESIPKDLEKIGRLEECFFELKKNVILILVGAIIALALLGFVTYDYLSFIEENPRLIVKLNGEEVPLEDAYINLTKKSYRDDVKLSGIQKRYNIEMQETDSTISYSSPKIDSALMLLPVYRDKIIKLEGKDEWIVSRENDGEIYQRHIIFEYK